ncbi:RNA polymerase sigma factor [Leucobacter sp. wl10]|uniref:RNA polymerase sigma factor n=1 Tax=Leucobacter sp. wl10 TaxID=2304677 RepID=UPI0013C30299|nr:sigma-70 family RNA polymerase sigma factor [Leucobacter sp. wl10]
MHNAKKMLGNMLPELVGYFSRRLGNYDDAADAASDTIVELLKRPNRLPDDLTRFRQYVYGTARNVLSTCRKGRLQRLTLTEHLKQELRAQEAEIHIHEDKSLAEAIAKLRAQDQELLLLVAWEGFGIAEAGAVLGLKPDTSRKRYSRIRQKLQTQLTPAAQHSAH